MTRVLFLFMLVWRPLLKMVGVRYIEQVVQELLWASDINKPAIGLHNDVKTSVVDFLRQIKSRGIGKEWWSLFFDKGLDASFLPYSNAPVLDIWGKSVTSDAYTFTHGVMVWHIATWYCEVAEKEAGIEVSTRGGGGGGGDGQQVIKNRRVAIALSRYCAYLLVSAANLLHGSSVQTKRAFDDTESLVRAEKGQTAEMLRGQPTDYIDQMMY